MPKIVAQPFVEYEFTEDEMAVAAVLSSEQQKWIETLLAQAAQEKATATYDPSLPDSKERYIFEQEYHRGSIVAYRLILDTSAEYTERATQRYLRQRASQADTFIGPVDDSSSSSS